jgi:hypothetical protein
MKRIFLVLVLALYSIINYSQTELYFDVYCNGSNGPGEMNQDNACFWKNGETIQLEPIGSRSSGLFVLNENVYISGQYVKKGITTACFWKNSIFIELPGTGADTYTSSIYVIGNDIYVSGHFKNENNITTACYWKNGIKKNLGQTANESCYTRSIFVNGVDVYVAGYSTYIKDNILSISACYWKNGIKKELNTSPYNLSIACEIKVDNNDIIIVGRLDDGKKECLSYWKNEVRNDLYTINNDYSNVEILQPFNMYEHADYIIFTAQYKRFPHKIAIEDFLIKEKGIYITGSVDNKAFIWDNGKIMDLNYNNISTVNSFKIFNNTDTIVVGTNTDQITLYSNFKTLNTYKIKDINPDKFLIKTKM